MVAPASGLASVAVIIPTLNEERSIGKTLESARAAGADEIIVSDGGSTDGTLEIARAAGARIVAAARMRAVQLNAAAAIATSDVLLFLHADTLLPSGAKEAILEALERGAMFGGFRISFLEPQRKLRIAAAMINIRTFFSRCPWGDQAQFIRRSDFEKIGGFREMPIMEDYEMAIRMRQAGNTAVLPLKVQTSGRRFLSKGVWATAAMNWRIIIAYRMGADPAKLRELYRKK